MPPEQLRGEHVARTRRRRHPQRVDGAERDAAAGVVDPLNL
ncbi:MAG: hypothetical protein ACXVFK_05955 [Solirubrobacteraceae bacterium]